LDILFNGVDIGGKKRKFPRRIATDSMTGVTDLGMRAVQGVLQNPRLLPDLAHLVHNVMFRQLSLGA